MSEKNIKWRLILGGEADPEQSVPLDKVLGDMDKALSALYDPDRKGGLGGSNPKINRWLGDIRTYFPESMVQIMQKDALERLNLNQILLEPDFLANLTPDVHLLATLIGLNKVMPDKTRETARLVIRQVVEDLEKKLKQPLRQAIMGALSRSVRNRRPKYNEIDWGQTIKANLKHYQSAYKTVIPENLRGKGRRGQALKQVILLVDESGSMAASVVYASILAAVMASIRAVKTHLVVFDTAVVDLTPHLADPVEVLFGTQLGGGTDIFKALSYADTLITQPNDTILILISDLFEGGHSGPMLEKIAEIKQKGTHFISLLALSDEGRPSYDGAVAQHLAQLDVPAFACTPDRFPELMAAAIERRTLSVFLPT